MTEKNETNMISSDIKSLNSFRANDPNKFCTLRVLAAGRETTDSNLLCKSAAKFLYQLQE